MISNEISMNSWHAASHTKITVLHWIEKQSPSMNKTHSTLPMSICKHINLQQYMFYLLCKVLWKSFHSVHFNNIYSPLTQNNSMECISTISRVHQYSMTLWNNKGNDSHYEIANNRHAFKWSTYFTKTTNNNQNLIIIVIIVKGIIIKIERRD